MSSEAYLLVDDELVFEGGHLLAVLELLEHLDAHEVGLAQVLQVLVLLVVEDQLADHAQEEAYLFVALADQVELTEELVRVVAVAYASVVPTLTERTEAPS